MSGYYPPNQHLPPQYYNVDPNAVPNAIRNPSMNGPPMMVSDGSIPPHCLPDSPVYHGLPGSFVQYPEVQMQQAYLDHYEEMPGNMGAAPGGNQRVRRRSAPGDQVKHRRTRSGCYTCRNRRVKCDETHPICERCRKGQRECVYPESQSKTGRATGKSGQKSSGDESAAEDELDDAKEPLPSILDDEEGSMETEPSTLTKKESFRESSNTPALTLDHSPSPSTEASSIAQTVSRPPISRRSSNQATKGTTAVGKSAAGLPEDIRFYLNYFRTRMGAHHYHLKCDSTSFLRTDFFDLVMKHEPLRYAVVGYAAYFHTLSKPNGRISNFLNYYNESVSRLRQSIMKSKRHSLATLVTILQLASIEEVLGDWVNLMGHQKAAYEILTKLYTPETIMKTALLRKVLVWYIRFDMFVGFQSGTESVLSREWYVATHDYYKTQAQENPNDLGLKYEERFSYSRMIAKESGDLFARKARGQMSDEDFSIQLPIISEKINNLDKTIDPVLLDPSGYVTDFHGEPGPENIVNPYEPNVIFQGELWPSNYLMLDMWGIMFMYHIQISMALKRPMAPEMTETAYRASQIFEAICSWPNSPPGSIIEAQASFAIASIFLPKDTRTTEWCRRAFVRIESAGYVYSDVLRNRFLESWNLEPADWWLPNDEGCPPIIRSMKNFIFERTIAPRDQTSEDLREMRGIFTTLSISDSPTSSENTGSTPQEVHAVLSGVSSNLDETIIYTGGSPDYEWGYEQDKYVPGAETYGQGQYPGH
ncbi:hypothetical protein P154DRAFT_142877 [Amniculicola lignicola CBS 123094]|uniref:Zn(2)-C6 fungal-type domain-containing protein n=1 Tax=Amniculicola lignicola CBS 123094 TaxID=1392246 RepID=A0A6A5WX60_9PLEO|nr:hypothetical protein P154DRAFT_142877 [Amniculicola lignicola CBS 123094]